MITDMRAMFSLATGSQSLGDAAAVPQPASGTRRGSRTGQTHHPQPCLNRSHLTAFRAL